MAARRVSRRLVAVLSIALLVGAAILGYDLWHAIRNPARCDAVVGSSTYHLTPEQARNATTIAAVGKRLGLADHAVTIGLAAALQESNLRNLDHGDRDSIGLFQQRPSQGWGTPAELITPRLAAEAFFRRLAQVPGWEAMSVTDAAQHVQRSAAPDAYAKWEAKARTVAIVTTGEVGAGLGCRGVAGEGSRAALEVDMARELGSGALDATVSPARGWTVATWLVGHASAYRIRSVTFSGLRWTPGSTAWERVSGAASGGGVRFET